MRPPAFQFYADDFLAGTMEMSQADVGAYIRLLCWQWNRGSIPVRTENQQRITGGPVSDDVISKFTPCPDGLLRNDRLEQEREKQTQYRERQRVKGIQSGKARSKARSKHREPRFNHGSTSVPTTVEPAYEPQTNSPSPSPDGETEEASASLASPPSVKTIATPEQIAARFAEMTAVVSANGHSLEHVTHANASEALTPTETAPNE